VEEDVTVAVTVVIPTRNRLPMLSEAVESVRRQTFAHWQLVVVDDASTDGTGEWLESLDDARIDVIRLEAHSERSAARNRGLAHARGRYVLFLDDDDRLRPRALERLRRPIKRRPDLIAAVGASIATVDGRRVRQRSQGRPFHPWMALTRSICAEVSLGWYALQGQALFRREALEEVSGYNEAVVIGEDYELWVRLAPMGPVAFVPSIVLERGVPPRPPPGEIPLATRPPLLYPEEVGELSPAFRRARRLYLDGVRLLYRGEAQRALWPLVSAIRTDPVLLLSPVMGPRTALTLAQVLIRSVAYLVRR
jgi:glycosyltransferase involved in cell wall biosynthesis